MDDWNFTQTTPFDRQFTTSSLLLTKLLIPYLPPETQRVMAIYVKFTELSHTLSSFQTFRQTSRNAQDIMQGFKPYLPPSVCESIDNFENIMSMMELFQSFQNSSDSDSDFDPMSMMKEMLTPEQQNMFEMYNTMFDTETKSETPKGGETDD